MTNSTNNQRPFMDFKEVKSLSDVQWNYDALLQFDKLGSVQQLPEDYVKLCIFIEGYKSKVYKCSEGHLTVGFGHMLTKTEQSKYSIGNFFSTFATAEYFIADLVKHFDEASSNLKFKTSSMPENLKVVVAYLHYNMGIKRFNGCYNDVKLLRANTGTFADTIEFLINWADNAWAIQVPRALRVISNYLLLGEISENHILYKNLDDSMVDFMYRFKDHKGMERLRNLVFKLS